MSEYPLLSTIVLNVLCLHRIIKQSLPFGLKFKKLDSSKKVMGLFRYHTKLGSVKPAAKKLETLGAFSAIHSLVLTLIWLFLMLLAIGKKSMEVIATRNRADFFRFRLVHSDATNRLSSKTAIKVVASFKSWNVSPFSFQAI